MSSLTFAFSARLAFIISYFRPRISAFLPLTFNHQKIPVQPFRVRVNPDGVEAYLVRLDALHPHHGGNKWFKLKYNLSEARALGLTTLITFGGAHSNHLRAAASAAAEYGFKPICVVRGERVEPLNPVLRLVERLGGRLHFVSREQYGRKSEPQFLESLQRGFGPAYVIPEGGANVLGVLGCSEIPAAIGLDFDLVACACGTFTTLAGLALGLKPHQRAVGFSVLKAPGYGEKQTQDLLEQTKRAYPQLRVGDWSVCDDYHFGGYAKSTTALERSQSQVLSEYGVETDFVYTAKLLYGVTDIIFKRQFKPGTRVAVVMSGADNAAL